MGGEGRARASLQHLRFKVNITFSVNYFSTDFYTPLEDKSARSSESRVQIFHRVAKIDGCVKDSKVESINAMTILLFVAVGLMKTNTTSVS